MVLLRILLIGVVLWIAMLIVRRMKLSLEARKKDIAHRGRMVNCEVCGVYLPESEAVSLQNGRFRCDEHRVQGGA